MKDTQLCAESNERIIFDFSDFYFSSYGHFSVIFLKKITPIFDDNSKNKNRKFFLLFFPFDSEHCASSQSHFDGDTSEGGGSACPSL